MAIVESGLPEKPGERRLATYLARLDDDRLHLWFSLNYIPGVKDIDLLAYHEDVGAFVIEVKAVSLRMIETFGLNTCRIVDRRGDRPPQIQADAAMYDLKNSLGGRFDELFLTSSVCWPLIFRDDWNESWSNEQVTGSYAKRMILQDDLDGTASAFVDRLKHIRSNPLIGNARPGKFRHSADLLERLRQRLNAVASKKRSQSDLEKLRIIEKRVADQVSESFDSNVTRRVVLSGGPGTGKTFRLLQSAYLYARSEKKTLYLCFNKVLAADIKRLFKLDSASDANAFIEVRDIYELLAVYFVKKQITGGVSYDEWAEDVIKDMLSDPSGVEKYEAIFVDEAQDLPAWAFSFVSALSTESTSVTIATGPQQKLYSTSKPSLIKFIESAELEKLSVNFRNTESIFKLATVFYDAFKSGDEALRVSLNQFKGTGNVDRDVAVCERRGGKPPLLVPIDETDLESDEYAPSFYLEGRDELMINVNMELIKRELESLATDESPLDLLILVPGEKSEAKQWVVSALDKLDLQYVDYTSPRKRRFIALADTIRVCTFHSSRGIEGQRVLIFGFEHIDKFAKQVHVDVNSLGYIALSRATIDLRIVHRDGKSEVLDFIRLALTKIRKG